MLVMGGCASGVTAAAIAVSRKKSVYEKGGGAEGAGFCSSGESGDLSKPQFVYDAGEPNLAESKLRPNSARDWVRVNLRGREGVL